MSSISENRKGYGLHIYETWSTTAPSSRLPGICTGQLCSHTMIPWPQGAHIPRSLPAGKTKFISFGARGTQKGECRQGQEFLHAPRMSLDSCAAPTIKRPCAIFWHSRMFINHSWSSAQLAVGCRWLERWFERREWKQFIISEP